MERRNYSHVWNGKIKNTKVAYPKIIIYEGFFYFNKVIKIFDGDRTKDLGEVADLINDAINRNL